MMGGTTMKSAWVSAAFRRTHSTGRLGPRRWAGGSVPRSSRYRTAAWGDPRSPFAPQRLGAFIRGRPALTDHDRSRARPMWGKSLDRARRRRGGVQPPPPPAVLEPG